MADKVVVYLKFATAGGKTSSVTINNPRENVTLADAKAAADVLVAQQVSETRSGRPGLGAHRLSGG
jgi:hypothetical protein